MECKGHESSVKNDDFQNLIDASSERTLLSTRTQPEILPITNNTLDKDHGTLPGPVQNETLSENEALPENEALSENEALGPATETNARPGVFRKAIRRFLNFFRRKNKVGVSSL